LYAQLKESILSAIARGELAPDRQLPSQRELCQSHGMSHMTVRRAISDLINEGVLYAIPGKGVFVANQKLDAEAGPLVSFADDMARRGMRSSSKVLAAEVTGASSILARALGVEPGTLLVHLHRLRLADGRPMALQACYLPQYLCPDLLDHDLEHNSLFAILREAYSLRLVGSSGLVEAALATEEQAEHLGLLLPAPVLVREQITYLDDGRAVEFVRSTYRGDLYRLKLGGDEGAQARPGSVSRPWDGSEASVAGRGRPRRLRGKGSHITE
jgi:GntR family transcriptional regulator